MCGSWPSGIRTLVAFEGSPPGRTEGRGRRMGRGGGEEKEGRRRREVDFTLSWCLDQVRTLSLTLNVVGSFSARSSMSRAEPTTLHRDDTYHTHTYPHPHPHSHPHIPPPTHTTHSAACPAAVTLPGDCRNLNSVRRREEGSMQISGFPARKQATMSSCNREN